MNTATAPGVAPAPQTPTLTDIVKYLRPGQRLAVTEVNWDDYEQLLRWRDDCRRTVRLTYDRGRLEIMFVSNLHGRLRKILALLIESWLAESGGDYLPSGQLTHKRKDLERGFEPDECYYVQNWKAVAGLREIDFTKDPPPDLTIEVEVSRSVLGRLPVFAAFKIPEVWRYDGEKVTILLLQPNGEYAESLASRAIPDFPFAEAPQFLALAADVLVGFGEIDRRFRQWIRSRPAPSAPNT
jgi:Uma2 family endonuclease